MDFEHFIITQFNLRLSRIKDEENYERWAKWTRNRIDLFRKYCLPSVQNQSSKEFTWLLYFDSETPDEFNGFINEMAKIPFVRICYSNGIEDFNLTYTNEIKSIKAGMERWLITTRLDNDDCLHKDAIKTIQENMVYKNKFLISLSSGYILNITDGTLSHYFYPMSPFISLIEDTGKEIMGVYEKGHTKWDNLRLFVSREIWHEYFGRNNRKSRFILKKPMWIQIVHGENISNSFYRGFPVLREKSLIDFSIDLRTSRQQFKIIRKYINYVIWKRYLKCIIIKTLLKK